MNYYNPIYGIFNEEKIRERIRQQQLQQFHNDQLESADKVSFQYRDIATLQCYAVLGKYFMKKMQGSYDVAHYQMLL